MNKTNLIITGIISPLIALIPTLILVLRDRERQKSPLAIRIIRKKAQIAKAELENQTRMEKLKLELKTLEEEAHYQEKMSKWESGELVEKTSEELDNLSSKISDLKEKGNQVVQKATTKVQQVAEDLKSKGAGVVKGLTNSLSKEIGLRSDQVKNLKDKIPRLKKEE